MKKMIIASLLALAITGYASAVPTVTLTGTYDATNWYVYATDSVGDNFGISFVSFKVGGIDVNTASGGGGAGDPGDASPQFMDWGGSNFKTLKGTYGFNSNTITVPVTPNQIDYAVIGIDPGTPTYALWGLGQGPVNVVHHGNFGSSATQTDTVPAKFLVATGTLLAGQTPFFVSGYLGLAAPLPFANGAATVDVSVSTGGASVYKTGVGSTASQPVGALFLAGAPEPATMALLAIGGAVSLIRRRRKA